MYTYECTSRLSVGERRPPTTLRNVICSSYQCTIFFNSNQTRRVSICIKKIALFNEQTSIFYLVNIYYIKYIYIYKSINLLYTYVYCYPIDKIYDSLNILF